MAKVLYGLSKDKAMKKKKSSQAKGPKLLKSMIRHLEQQGRLGEEKNYIQHGTTTVFAHSVRVASLSLKLAKRLHLKVNRKSLLRGALLHDYFLYDWHEKDRSHRLHGLYHAGTALKNAKKDFHLNKLEENIIARHMFPLNPIFPRYKEAWIVCLADKYCAAEETIRPFLSAGKNLKCGLLSTMKRAGRKKIS